MQQGQRLVHILVVNCYQSQSWFPSLPAQALVCLRPLYCFHPWPPAMAPPAFMGAPLLELIGTEPRKGTDSS